MKSFLLFLVLACSSKLEAQMPTSHNEEKGWLVYINERAVWFPDALGTTIAADFFGGDSVYKQGRIVSVSPYYKSAAYSFRINNQSHINLDTHHGLADRFDTIRILPAVVKLQKDTDTTRYLQGYQYSFSYNEKKVSLFYNIGPTLSLRLYPQDSVRVRQPNILNDTTSAIWNVVALKGDTLIASKWYYGIIASYNAGKTWNVIDSIESFNQMTVDENGVLWGLDTWGTYSYLSKSVDKGRNWNTHEFDVKKFFPYQIFSKRYEPLRVITIDRKVYELNGDDLENDWRFIEALPNYPDEIVEGKYKITKETVYKLRNNRWDSVYKLDDFYVIAFHPTKDGVYIGGSNWGTSKARFVFLNNKNQLREYKLEGTDVNGLEIDSKGRMWVFNCDGIFLFKDQKFIRVY